MAIVVPMNDRIKISVAVITYNQQDTIRQTLDSILMQKGDFDLELVIGEDCSTDSTRAICEEYVHSFTRSSVHSLVLLPSQKNLGIMANTARVFEASTGDFISIIAGDDYYCNDYALDKQMRFMQLHPEVGVMAANGYNYYVLRNEKVPGVNQPFEAAQEPIKSYYFSSNHMEGVCLAPTGMMFRAELIRKYIDFAEILRRQLPVEDFPIQAILSQHTYFACLPDLLVTYRVYKESASFISYNHPQYLSYYKGLMDIRRYLNELFPADACATEEQLAERMFTKEFYYYVFHGDFQAVKQLVASAPPELQNSMILTRAKQLSTSRILFIAYHYYKQFSVRRSINKQL